MTSPPLSGQTGIVQARAPAVQRRGALDWNGSERRLSCPQGAPTLPGDLRRVAASDAACVLIVSDSSRCAEGARLLRRCPDHRSPHLDTSEPRLLALNAQVT